MPGRRFFGLPAGSTGRSFAFLTSASTSEPRSSGINRRSQVALSLSSGRSVTVVAGGVAVIRHECWRGGDRSYGEPDVAVAGGIAAFAYELADDGVRVTVRPG